MIDFDRWMEVWAVLSRNKLRTMLTALGVFWGIFLLVVAVAFARGLETGTKEKMSGFATNSVYVWGGRTTMPYKGMQPGRWIRFENADIDAVKRVEGVDLACPRLRVGGWPNGVNVYRGSETGNFTVMGDFPEFNQIMNMDMIEGRYINPIDIEQRRKVAVIGEQVVAVLFPDGENPIGEHVMINGVWFQVVGIFKPTQDSEDADRHSQTLMVPFTTAQQAFNLQNTVGFFALLANPNLPADEVEQRVRVALAERHRLDPRDAEAFGSFNAAEEFGKITTIMTGIQLVTWVVGFMTLLAGALGVSNILLISVKERTKEIGVRKALGAPPMSIVQTILQEALVLTAVSGYLGLVFGVAALEALGAFVDFSGPLARPEVDFGTAIVSVLILVGAGLVAGLIPARHAARIPPVEALRAEL